MRPNHAITSFLAAACLSITATFVCPNARGANPPRFIARFANGTVVESNSLVDWHAPETAPKLENISLFDPSNPVRWLMDRTQQPTASPPDSYVELATGDLLPGTVVDFRTGEETAYARLPAHLFVRHDSPNLTNLELSTAVSRVDLRWLRKVVWSRRRETSWEPRTAFLRDGSQLKFRSARWGIGSVSLLLETGPRRVDWGELAELHLPPGDFWSQYYDELSLLTPDGAGRLLQVETNAGLVATTSLARTLPRVVGDVKDVQRWLLGIQPAWCLDVLWIRQGSVWCRRSFSPQEVLLSRLAPSRVVQQSWLRATAPPYVVNRGILGGALKSQARDAGWGFGVQARSELDFDLPPAARVFRAEFALDPFVESGGCVQPAVLMASAGNAVLYQGPVLIGAEKGVETGALTLSGAADAPKKLTLVVDPVVANRPPNADPLDIRDQGVWLDPLVELDPAAVKAQLDQRLPQVALAWRGWTPALEAGGQVALANFFADGPANGGEFRTTVAVAAAPLVLRRQHTPNLSDRWLVVDVVRTLPPGPPAKLAVRIADQMPIEWDLPNFDKTRGEFKPLIVPVPTSANAAAPLPIEIRQLAGAERVPLLWRAIHLSDQHPAFFQVVEESLPESRNAVAGGPPLNSLGNAAKWDDTHKYMGTKSIQLNVDGRLALKLDRPVAIRERPQLGEYRFLRFVVRKQGGGGLKLLVHHAAEGDRPAQFFAGPEPMLEPGNKRLTDQNLPMDWQVFTRDLYGDFGDIEVSGLEFSWLGGQQGWLDHVYLARTQSDFDLIQATLPK